MGFPDVSSSVTLHERRGLVSRRFLVDGAHKSCTLVDIRHRGRTSSSFLVMLAGLFHSMFLPEGYPHSVSADYGAYQLWDTLQALCSSVTGTLSTRAILHGVGVGEAAATASAGAVQFILKDMSGMLGRIWFASRIASNLDNDAKRWRLVADITNDFGLMLEILSSHLPKTWFLGVICIASLSKAVTCVAGGASRSSLTRHFAIQQNTAEVSAKDGSQETAVNIVGLLLGILLTYFVPETFGSTTAVFVIFTVLHLYCNFRAVRSLQLNHLNQARYDIILSSHLKGGPVPPPVEVNAREGVLWNRSLADLSVTLGVPLREVIALFPATPKGDDEKMKLLAQICSSLETYHYATVLVRERAGGHNPRALVVVSPDAQPVDMLEAYYHIVACGMRQLRANPSAVTLLSAVKGQRDDFTSFLGKLQAAGWNTDRVQLRVHDWQIAVGK